MAEVRRFNLLQFEPYLTFLSSDKSINLALTQQQDKFLETLKQEVKKFYKGENEDYIDTILNTRLKNIPRENSYITLGQIALREIANKLIKSSQIQSYELYKFVGLYIEPLQILIAYTLSNNLYLQLDNLREENFYELSFLGNRDKSDLHIHAETSYLFRNLLELLIRHIHFVNKELLKVSLDDIIRDLNFIISVHAYLKGKTVDIAHIKALLFSRVPLFLPQHLTFKCFKYKEFVFNAISKLFNGNNAEEQLVSLLALQKINTLMQKLIFKGEYKGLKHMRQFFSNFLKKVYQRLRYKSSIYINLEFLNDTSIYAELRISPEIKQLEYWSDLFKKTAKDKHKLIIHYKKFETLEESLKFFFSYAHQKSFLYEPTKEFFKGILKEVYTKQPIGYKNIVGFDAASIEYWTPPWVFRDIFRFWKTVFKNLLGKDVYFTFHAGEDFIDSATGLRYIYEAIKFLNVRRIGHGLAVFIDFRRYHIKYRYIDLPLLHYFFHLLWLNHLIFLFPKHLQGLHPYIIQALEELKSDLGKLSKHLQMQNINSESLLSSYETLGFFETLYKWATVKNDFFHRFLRNAILANHKDIKLAKRVYYLIKEIAHLNFITQKHITISPLLPEHILPDTDLQIEFIEKIALCISSIIRERNVCIEVCPSSNVILYNLRSFKDHPAFSFKEDFKISINTDNPLLFNTNLLLELLLAKEAIGDEEKFIKILTEESNFRFA